MGDSRRGRSQLSSTTLSASFRYAWLGLCVSWLTQRNFRLHVCAFWVVLGLAILLPLPETQTLLVLLASASVLLAELFNTAIEWLLDSLVPEYSPLVGHIKNVAAAAVLVTALTAAGLGAAVFGPVIFRLPDLLGQAFAAYPVWLGVYAMLTFVLGLVSILVPMRKM